MFPQIPLSKNVRFFHSFVDSCIGTICHLYRSVRLWEDFILPRNNLFHTFFGKVQIRAISRTHCTTYFIFMEMIITLIHTLLFHDVILLPSMLYIITSIIRHVDALTKLHQMPFSAQTSYSNSIITRYIADMVCLVLSLYASYWVRSFNTQY